MSDYIWVFFCPCLLNLHVHSIVGDEAGEDDADVLNRLKDIVAKGAAKKRVMRPQPKLNADR